MTALERFCGRIRHNSWLAGQTRVWNLVRPAYNAMFSLLNTKGVPRLMNGTDRIRLSPKLRGFPDEYEPEVWREVMKEIGKGGVFVDVGAYIGLYSIAVAKRLREGRVFAFEPDRFSFDLLKRNLKCNGLRSVVTAENKAIANGVGRVSFTHGKGREARLLGGNSGTDFVDCTRLDTYFCSDRVDVIKIDVEGFEEMVLAGGVRMLSDPERRPRAIFIEVHPFAWPGIGTDSKSLLALLGELGYCVTSLGGERVAEIKHYGEIVARSRS